MIQSKEVILFLKKKKKVIYNQFTISILRFYVNRFDFIIKSSIY